jgi:hypothetical protein
VEEMHMTEAARFDSPPFIAMSQTDPIGVLLAFEEIRNLKSRYLAAVDDKDWHALQHEIFTAEAVVDFSAEGAYHVGHHGVVAEDIDPTAWRVVGGAAAAVVIEGAVADVVTVHQCHDPQLVLVGPDEVRGRWTMYDRLEYGGEVMHGYGHYHETYRRIDGRWWIDALLLTRLRVVWAPY